METVKKNTDPTDTLNAKKSNKSVMELQAICIY